MKPCALCDLDAEAIVEPSQPADVLDYAHALPACAFHVVTIIATQSAASRDGVVIVRPVELEAAR